MRSRLKTVVMRTVAAVGFVTMSAAPAHAQLNTQHLKGSSGLKAGTQAPPHWYAIAPLIYVYHTGTIRNSNGDKVEIPGVNLKLTTSVFGGGFLRVTTRKILGGNYAYQLLFPIGASNRVQGTEIDFRPGAGLTDTYLQPFSLGWHFSRADFVAGYALFIPTGRFEPRSLDNTGFGMWGNEFSLGTTVFFDAAKKYHAATLATLDIQSKKRDTNTKVGNVLNLEGGFGHDYMEGGLTFGVTYYASFKLTDDEIGGVPGILVRGKDRVVAVGPALDLALARGNKLYGILKLNYQIEVYARTTTQGQTFNASLSFPIGPITIP